MIFAREGIGLYIPSRERFDEDQVSKIFWDTPFTFEKNWRIEESLQPIERQKENYQEVVSKSDNAYESAEERLKSIFQHGEAGKTFYPDLCGGVKPI